MTEPAPEDSTPSHDGRGPQRGERFGEDARAMLLQLLTWRRDVRRFKRDALPPGIMQRLVQIACLAPSVGLSQPWRFVVVEDEARRAAVRASFAQCNAEALRCQADERAGLYARLKLAGLDDAPCQFAVFADRATGKGHGLGRMTMPSTIDFSAVMAVHTLWLAARAEGIGLGWVSILDPEAVTAVLDVPLGWAFIGFFCMGFAVDDDSVPVLEREGWESRGDPAAVLLQR